MSDVAAAVAAEVSAAWAGNRAPTGEPLSTCETCGAPIVLDPPGWTHRDGLPPHTHPHLPCPPPGLGDNPPEVTR